LRLALGSLVALWVQTVPASLGSLQPARLIAPAAPLNIDIGSLLVGLISGRAIPATMSLAHARRRKQSSDPFTVEVFALEGRARPPRKRSCFSQPRRAKVHAVRDRGACLRCKALKLPVSHDSGDAAAARLLIRLVL
jgi:hypothetical protein